MTTPFQIVIPPEDCEVHSGMNKRELISTLIFAFGDTRISVKDSVLAADMLISELNKSTTGAHT